MAKELSEESKFQISVKTLVTIVVAVATVISAYFGLMASINSKFAELEGKVEKYLLTQNMLSQFVKYDLKVFQLNEVKFLQTQISFQKL